MKAELLCIFLHLPFKLILRLILDMVDAKLLHDVIWVHSEATCSFRDLSP